MSGWLAQAAVGQIDDYSGFLLRIAVSIGLGGLIGFERELRDKPAGFRTIILICLGACLFAIMSDVAGGPDGEHTRIAAQIVSGIGFLGAGAILRDRQTIVGLTTAATIWSVAAVGIAVGFGHIVLGIYGTAAILVALLLFDGIEKWIGNRRDIQDYDFLTGHDDEALARVKTLFSREGLHIRKLRFYESDSSLHFSVIAMGSKTAHETLRFTLAQSDQWTLKR